MRATLKAIFATMAVFLIVSVCATYWIGDRTIRKGKEVVERRSAIDQLNTTLSTLKDAETGERG
jgi:CHASE3 domain sensor protein